MPNRIREALVGLVDEDDPEKLKIMAEIIKHNAPEEESKPLLFAIQVLIETQDEK
jgi:hypothetical protein